MISASGTSSFWILASPLVKWGYWTRWALTSFQLKGPLNAEQTFHISFPWQWWWVCTLAPSCLTPPSCDPLERMVGKFIVRKEALASILKRIKASGSICILLYLPEQTVLFLDLAWANPKPNTALVFLDKSQSCLRHGDSKGLRNCWPQFKRMQWFAHRRQKFVIRILNPKSAILEGHHITPTSILNDMLKASYHFKSIEL